MAILNVLITGGGSGGHVSPALAVAQRIKEISPEAELLYVGGNMTMEGSAGESLEARLVRPTGIPLKIIHVGKLKRGGFSISTITRLWGFFPGLFEAWHTVRKFMPNVIFSSGGYVSLPVVIAGWVMRVPIVIHEQTAAVGLANSIAGKLATKVAITFPQSARYFAKNKTVVTGNPIQPAILNPDPDQGRRSELGQWLASGDEPLLYVTGGGLGSHVINMAILEILPQLLSDYRVVHQCGAHAGYNDIAHLKRAVEMLPEEISRRYYVAPHLSPIEVGWLYTTVQLVVARAGANTVLELAAKGLAAIFIPIPWVTHDEQTKNASVLVEAGTASILPEKELNGRRLLSEITSRMASLDELDLAREAAKALVDRNAAVKLTDVVLELARRSND